MKFPRSTHPFSLLILLSVVHELSFDSFHVHADRMFVPAAALALAVAMVTASYRTIRAALAYSVKSLRYE